jgi:hypothetical protein
MSRSSNKNSPHNDNEVETKKSGVSDQASSKAQNTTPQPSPKWNAKELERFRELYGTDDPYFLNGVAGEICNLCPSRNPEEIQYVASVLRDAKPQSHLERMLVLQLYSTHRAKLRIDSQMACDLNSVPMLASASRQLGRLFLDQLAALKGGSATATSLAAPAVNVTAQAINVVQSPTARNDSAKKQITIAPAAITDAKARPMPKIEKAGKSTVEPAARPRYRCKIKI